jgi:hypothetical protein
MIKKNIAVSASGLIFNPDTGESFSVNPLGADIITYLKDGNGREAIVQKVMEKFQVEKASFEKDFDDFMDLMQTYLLIENDE